MFRGMTAKQRRLILSILLTETAERVAFFGFRAVLVLYFSEALRYNDNQSVSMFGVTSAIAYLSPVLGALLADGAWGRYRTIWNFGWMYAFGLCLLTAGAYSAESQMDLGGGDGQDASQAQAQSLALERFLSFIGLLLVCTGTGGIKPCVSAFGADQITVKDDTDADNADDINENCNGNDDNGEREGCLVTPIEHTNVQAETFQDEIECVDAAKQEEEHLRLYFASFYFCVNVGALASFAVIPIVKQHFGYGMAFSVPTVFMVFALAIFGSQKRHYKHSNAQERASKELVRQDSGVGDEDASLTAVAETPSLWDTFKACAYVLLEKLRSRGRTAAYSQVSTSTINQGSGQSQQTLFAPHINDKEQAGSDGESAAVTQPQGDQTGKADVTHNGGHQQGGADCADTDCSNDNTVMMQLQRRTQEQTQAQTLQHSEEVSHGDALCKQSKVYEDARQIVHLLPIMLLFPMFWMLYDQQGSVWILQASRMALHGLEPEELNILNPLEIMIFIPLFDQIVYPFMENHDWDISPTSRIKYGMYIASLSFAASSVLEVYIQSQPPSSVHVAWQVPQITIITIAEIFVNVTGLEFAYAQAPDNMQVLILALYLSMTSMGDVLGAALYSSVFTFLNLKIVLAVCATLMLLNTLIFMRVSARWSPYERTDCPRSSQEDHAEFGGGEVEMQTTRPKSAMSTMASEAAGEGAATCDNQRRDALHDVPYDEHALVV